MFFMDRTLILDSHTPLLLTLSGSQNSQVGPGPGPGPTWDPLDMTLKTRIPGCYNVPNDSTLLLVIIGAHLNQKSSHIFRI